MEGLYKVPNYIKILKSNRLLSDLQIIKEYARKDLDYVLFTLNDGQLFCTINQIQEGFVVNSQKELDELLRKSRFNNKLIRRTKNRGNYVASKKIWQLNGGNVKFSGRWNFVVFMSAQQIKEMSKTMSHPSIGNYLYGFVHANYNPDYEEFKGLYILREWIKAQSIYTEDKTNPHLFIQINGESLF